MAIVRLWLQSCHVFLVVVTGLCAGRDVTQHLANCFGIRNKRRLLLILRHPGSPCGLWAPYRGCASILGTLRVEPYGLEHGPAFEQPSGHPHPERAAFKQAAEGHGAVYGPSGL